MKLQNLIFALLLTSGIAYGQPLDVANEYFENSMYREALPLFEKFYKNKNDKGEFAYKIAECYRNMNLTGEALMWYDSALVHQYAEPKLRLHYGESLLREGRYAEAQKMLATYVEVNPSDEYSKQKLESSIYANDRPNGNPYIKVEPLADINTDGYEYAVAEFQGRLVYSYGEKREKGSARKVASRTGTGYSQLYIAEYDSAGALKPQVMEGLHEARASEAGFAYDSIMGVAYITRSSSEQFPYTRIVAYKYKEEENKWEKPDKALRAKLFKVDSAVTGHPFITSDGQRFYFSGILPGGFGGSDIWYADRQPDSTWGKPVNAGVNVNTAGDEVFPSMYDGVLYFSSTGHVGYGGFDLFASTIANGKFGQAQNLGRFINSNRDDMSFLLSKSMRRSFFVSDSKGGTFDDIYTFNYLHPNNLEVIGKVVDFDGVNIPAAKVQVAVDGEETYSTTSDSSGRFLINVVPGKGARLEALKVSYIAGRHTLPAFTDMFGVMDLTNAAKTPHAVVVLRKPYPHGIVYNVHTLQPIVGAVVAVVQNGDTIAHLTTNAQGQYVLNTDKPSATLLQASHVGFVSVGKELSVADLTAPRDTNNHLAGLDIYLDTVVVEPIPVTHIANLKNVYYGFDKQNLCPESLRDLDKLVDFLKTNPSSRIELAAHTDIRGSRTYNQRLSKKRAMYVVDYLTSKGVRQNRISYKACGESQLYIADAQSEEEHWLNRRTEFVVLDANGETLAKSVAAQESEFSDFCGGMGRVEKKSKK